MSLRILMMDVVSERVFFWSSFGEEGRGMGWRGEERVFLVRSVFAVCVINYDSRTFSVARRKLK